MNNTNSPSQHTHNNKTFAEIASNTTLPKMNQAILLILSITSNKSNISPQSVKLHPLKIYNMFLVFQTTDFASFSIAKMVWKIYLKSSHRFMSMVSIYLFVNRRLIKISKRIILSNVYPTIPN